MPSARAFLSALLIVSSASIVLAQKKPLAFADIMKFRQITGPVISDDGNWVSYCAQPDRGDGEVVIRAAESGKTITVARGTGPTFSRDSRWVAMSVSPPAVELEKKEKEKDKPKSGVALVNVSTGVAVQADSIDSFAFSEDSRWFAYLKSKVEGERGAPKDTSKQAKKKRESVGTDCTLRNLKTGQEVRIPFVTSYAFDSTAHFLAYSRTDTSGTGNGVYVRELQQEGNPEGILLMRENGVFTNLAWSNATGRLAFVAATLDDKENPGPASVWLWNPGDRGAAQVISSDMGLNGWILPSKNDVAWGKDGKQLFFGVRPISVSDTATDAEDSTVDLFDTSSLLKKREVNVWNWNDPRIISNQKNRWKNVKDQTYRGVYDIERGSTVSLADLDMPVVSIPQNPRVALGRSDVPYLKDITWEGQFNDYYLVELSNGKRKKIVSRLDGPAYLSPSGGFVLYYSKKQWFLYDIANDSTHDLTSALVVPFWDEEDDTPDPPRAYGFGGWVDGGNGLLLYDKYDVWQIATSSRRAENITTGTGRRNDLTFRIQHLDREATFFKDREELLLSAYHNHKKYTAFYAATAGKAGVRKLAVEPKRFTFLAKARHADRILYTRQSYTEFPDLWISDLRFKSPRRISDVNPQIADFAWGSAELVDWLSVDGVPLQGVLIKPGNYEPGKRYPVLVYFYELSSQRLYDFDEVVINHRPCFPLYAGNGYAVFLPDVRFETGRPGFSATKCVVPGVQKLIEMGVADPKAIALHGHSWGGYETAFMVTQTNLFACAIAGAPVSNMTSAYSGIRQESGLARQFQYEEEQSRIGGSLWEYPERYIENSPVFFADKIKTPLLIEFGDEDGAVPWEQGIELYLAMRRLGKECVMLEYRGEPHHLKKYPNKLDYSVKFKEFLDHYLKGAPAPEWLAKGVPYSE